MPQPIIAAALHGHLQHLAQRVTSACPDLREQVRGLALAFLDQHGLAGLEPEQVHWHRFTDATSSPRAFSGWAHYQTPVESMTLVQLIMHRFNSGAQDANDELDVMSGFYTEGPGAERYDEGNEVRLLPHQLLGWLWKIDFKPAFLARVSAFWGRHFSDFRLLAKAHFIAQVLEERQAEALTDADAAFLFHALLGSARAPLTLETLEQHYVPPPEVRVYPLQLGAYQACDILCVESPAGEYFVWMPGEVDSVRKFDSLETLNWWLLIQNKDAEPRARFMLHFPLGTYLAADNTSGLNHTIDLLYATWGSAASTALFHHPEQRLTQDAFSYLAQRARERMPADAEQVLHSNGELRKKLWMSYLGAFNRVFGPMAAVDWPVALAVVGAGLANMSLNIDQAVNAPTRAERHAGVVGAVLAGIDALFNSLYLWGAWGGDGDAETLGEGLAAQIDTAQPTAVTELATPPKVESMPIELPDTPVEDGLTALQTNVLLDAYMPGRSGIGKGIYALPDGNTYASIDGIAYVVRYAPELRTWMAVDPENPFSFHRGVALRPRTDGEWEAIARPGLKGGGKLDGLLACARRPKIGELSPPVPSAYDLPNRFHSELADMMLNPADRTLQGYADLFKPDTGIEAAFNEARKQLSADARAFFSQAQAMPHPTAPTLAPNLPLKQAIRSILEHSKGLIIGEAHHQVAPKQLLIEQMPRFAKEGVDTLYMEHLLTDAHQADLDALLATGKMPDRLGRYLKLLDSGHNTDPTGRYTFTNVVRTAAQHRIRIRALDCAASYKELPNGFDQGDTTRQQLMNYYAHRVITAAPPEGKWLALMGNSHTDNYLGIPGVSDLEGVTSLRAEDVPLGTPASIDPDPGLFLTRRAGPPVLIKSDLRLRFPVTGGSASRSVLLSPEAKLPLPGDYFIAQQGSQLEVIHRNRAGELVHTPVQREDGQYFIQREQWPQVSGRRYPDLQALAVALRLIGLKRIG